MGWTETRITHRHDWAEELFTFRLDRSLDFKAGQFVNLGFDVDGKRERRSYSIASAPGAPLEFLVTVVKGGILTHLLADLGVGDRLAMEERPAGFLTLDEVPEFARDLWLLSTGTGLAPFISMLRSGALDSRFERVVCVNGARTNAHLAYREELVDRERGRPGAFRYLPTVTREAPEAGTLAGRITDALSDGRLEDAAGFGLDAERSHVMLCGNPAMIEDALAILVGRGLKRNRRRAPGHLTIEKYW